MVPRSFVFPGPRIRIGTSTGWLVLIGRSDGKSLGCRIWSHWWSFLVRCHINAFKGQSLMSHYTLISFGSEYNVTVLYFLPFN